MKTQAYIFGHQSKQLEANRLPSAYLFEVCKDERGF